jgi:hypothetical protein
MSSSSVFKVPLKETFITSSIRSLETFSHTVGYGVNPWGLQPPMKVKMAQFLHEMDFCNDPKPNYFLESLTTTNLLSY